MPWLGVPPLSHGLHSTKFTLIINNPSSYNDNLTLFPDRNKVNLITPVRNRFYMKYLKTYLFRDGDYQMVLTGRVDTLENLCEKRMFIGYTHSRVYYFSNSFPGQKTQIPEPGTWQRC